MRDGSVRRFWLGVPGLIAVLATSGVRADTFREIGVVPPLANRSLVATGADPDANLPTESMRPHPAVVRVIVPESGSTSYGSGTLVDVNGEHGLVLTNRHVVADASSPPTVLFADGFRSLARVAKTDKDWDLAALVIWRPNVEPVPVAAMPPQPGDLLAIAGYGQGPYRLASGRCTNYLAPNTRLPREMVELAAAARQGDSGGPIFNQQGELAGVLWGEGNGFTTGSYCGRVRQFLASVLPPESADGERQMVAVPPRAAVRRGAQASMAAVSHAQPAGDGAGWPDETVLARRPGGGRPSSEVSQIDSPMPADGQAFDWQSLLGRTRGEQGKTVLAIIGAMAVALRVRRTVGSKGAD
ncbi:MAG TPA: serine protease [Pirellulales bacterium]|nr:serine protease [Pirellulales bacterium]